MQLEILKAADRGFIQAATHKGYPLFKNHKGFGKVHAANDQYLYPEVYLGKEPYTQAEIVTILLNGKASFTNHEGQQQSLTEGAVQLVKTGTGIEWWGHNQSLTDRARYFQLIITPRKQALVASEAIKLPGMPVMRNTWMPFINPTGSEGALQVDQDVWAFRGVFDRGHHMYAMQSTQHGLLAYVLSGKLKVGEEVVETEDTIFLEDAAALEFEALHASEILLVETVL
ncbi:redox-sensitive bicupin YhaK (pirin superfamily) [Chitinophaga skermanii]|uniref:Redox-sensitive bicupin YhaK (Pirin superfamily) n=1 Tax=Chitinophaga skermanii TaxID=331697 RepID=A0A327QFI0_9BACT|nr:pirin family protein [Chitinophaga skermanii]RAJ02372.1 redox-sensitive bicupin YhaK (pirin superfamily) [Chitinophaga skermanii]